MSSYFDNTGRLTRFVLRRERVISSIWILILMFFCLVVPIAIDTMYGGETGPAEMAVIMENPAMAAMCGPLYGETLGAVYACVMLLFTAIPVAVMNIFLVVRHTRGDEERGRAEVIRSLPVGRLSGLSATMIAAVIINALIAVLCGLSMAVLGIDSMDFAGSMLFGAACGATGLLFAAITAVFVQLSSTTRGAAGYSFVIMAVFYMLRAMGDISSEPLSMVSPLGLILRTKVYAGNQWGPVFVILLQAAVVAAAAYCLNAIRDMGQGFIPAKPGRKSAKKSLLSSFGLSARLLRNLLIAWFVVMLIAGAAYGSIMGDVDAFVNKNELLQQMLPKSDTHSNAELLSCMFITMLALVSLIPVAMSILKLRGEEKDGYSENVLARAVSRKRYMSGYVIFSFVSSLIMTSASAVGLWAAAASVMESPIRFGSVFGSMMVYLPALWVMIGLLALLIGAAPKATGIFWAYFGFSFFVAYLGEGMGLPQTVIKMTPFGHIPQIIVDEVNWATLVVLTLLAAALTAAGFVFYRKRDMTA